MQCPLCGSKMHSWHTRKGTKFWVCSERPVCPGIMESGVYDYIQRLKRSNRRLREKLGLSQTETRYFRDRCNSLQFGGGSGMQERLPTHLGEYIGDVAKNAIARSQAKQGRESYVVPVRLECGEGSGDVHVGSRDLGHAHDG